MLIPVKNEKHPFPRSEGRAAHEASRPLGVSSRHLDVEPLLPDLESDLFDGGRAGNGAEGNERSK